MGTPVSPFAPAKSPSGYFSYISSVAKQAAGLLKCHGNILASPISSDNGEDFWHSQKVFWKCLFMQLWQAVLINAEGPFSLSQNYTYLGVLNIFRMYLRPLEIYLCTWNIKYLSRADNPAVLLHFLLPSFTVIKFQHQFP